ncbi:MAG: hypothetical protein Fur0032_19930 [Terrimicrobiaceae bacterium]
MGTTPLAACFGSILETLEARVAPASLVAGGKEIRFVDADGDNVTIKLSEKLPDTTDPANVFKFTGAFGDSVTGAFGDSGPQTIQEIDLTAAGFTAEQASKLKIDVKTKKAGMGNGTTDVPLINATGLDISKVKVTGALGSIVAGDGNTKTQAVGVIEVGSLGTTPSALPTGPVSTLTGGVDILKVGGNVGGQVNISGDGPKGAAQKIEIKGSLNGSSGEDSGQINVTGDVKSVVILGGVQGGGGENSGQLNVIGNVQGLQIGGVTGSTGTASGQVKVSGNVTLGTTGDISGGSGTNSGQTDIGGIIKKGKVGDVSGLAPGSGRFSAGGFDSLVTGSVTGGDADSGRVELAGGGKSLTVESVYGGYGLNSGGVSIGGPISKLWLPGSVTGSTGNFSGGISVAAGDLNGDGIDDIVSSAKVGGDIVGGSGNNSGQVNLPGTKSFQANNLLGGDGDNSGAVFIHGPGGKFVIKLDLASGTGADSGAVSVAGKLESATVMGARGGSFLVDGDLKKFQNKFGSFTGAGGGLNLSVNGNLGSAKFGGPVFETTVSVAGIPSSTVPALGSLSINGEANGLNIFGGFSDPETPVNADAVIGKVAIKGSVNNTNVWSGVEDFDGDGIPDKINGGAHSPQGVIRVFSVGGEVTNSTFFAPEVVVLNVDGAPPLLDGPRNDDHAFGTGNFVSELPPP